ncbi:MAG TPA: hypothetical protein VHB25_08225 [Gemmatimonadaceae bacterium]|nr:hypothetical protein [Gemmatimonadaceae bacterium]
MKLLSKTCVAALLAVVAGCGRKAPVGSGPYADKVADDVPQIEHALGVKFKSPPKLELRTRDQVRDFLVQKLHEPDMQKEIANQEATYKLLGLIPDTMHLANFFVRVLTEQIIGYYDPKTKILYVVQGAPEEYVGITIMHELIHALQDQYTNLDSLERITGDDDRAAAAQAVIEGQATYEQLYIMAGGAGNVAAQLPGGWEAMRDEIRESQKTQPVFSSAPMVIQETLLFPYINGADFVRRWNEHHKHPTLPFDSLPVSTEQLMHDAAYFGHPQDVPSIVKLPPIPGTVTENDFGEFGTRLYLFKWTNDQDRSIRASNGWDGDRYALVKTPSGNALVWATVWDAPGDAAEFMSALDSVQAARLDVQPTVSGDERRYLSNTRTVDVNVRTVQGRPVVLYVDVPRGVSTNLVDFAKVQVTPR